MPKHKLIAVILLLLAIASGYWWIKPVYKGFDVSDKIPSVMPNWDSQDVSSKVKASARPGDIVGEVVARVYVNRQGQGLLFMVLDAGNFHNPKVCYGSSGFEIQELQDTEMMFGQQTIKAQTVLLKNGRSSRLLLYWLCLDKEIAGWGQQKFVELFNSLLNQKKTQLMVRVEVDATESGIENSIELAKLFVKDVYSYLPSQYGQYVFGRMSVTQ